MCFVWIWEQTAIISLYSINWLVFITETECAYCAVRTLNVIQANLQCSLYALSHCHNSRIVQPIGCNAFNSFFRNPKKRTTVSRSEMYRQKNRPCGQASHNRYKYPYFLTFPISHCAHLRSTYKWQSHWSVFIPPPQSSAFTLAPYIWLGSDSVRRRFEIAITTLVTAVSLF